MDNLTHALSGVLLAKAVAPAAPAADAPTLGQRMLASAIVTGVAPDLDFVVTYVSTPLAYLHNHRGVTHSLLMLPLWAVLLGALWSWLHRRNLRLWRDYAGLFAMGIALHIAFDVITPFGTMIFAPLSDVRYTLSTTFIVDLWMTGLLLAGVVVAVSRRASRWPAVAALTVVAGYIGFQSVLRDRAIEFGAAYARDAGLHGARVRALPSPLSPFNWLVVVQEPLRMRFSYVNQRRDVVPSVPGPDAGFFARLDAPYRPLAHALWSERTLFGDSGDGDRALAEEAWRAPAFAFFRWFAEYPMLGGVERSTGSACVWFEDLRFVTPGRDNAPFRYGMCRDDAAGIWQAKELRADGSRAHVY